MQAGLQSVLAIYSYKAASISDVLLVLCNHLAVKASNMVRAPSSMPASRARLLVCLGSGVKAACCMGPWHHHSSRGA